MQLAMLVRNWRMMAVRGVFAILFGLTLVLWHDVTLPTLVVLFAAYAVLDGLWAIGAATRASERSFDTWPVALEGVVSVGLGGIALLWPFVSREFIYVVAFWGLLTGALEILTAVAMPREAAGHWLFGTGGVSSVFLALLVLMVPRAGATGIVRLIAVYALVFGVLVSLTAIRFQHRARRRPDHALGNAAQQRTAQPRSPVRAKHDQVDVVRRRVSHDLLGRITGRAGESRRADPGTD